MHNLSRLASASSSPAAAPTSSPSPQSIRDGRLPGVEIAVVISNVADAPGIGRGARTRPAARGLRLQRPPARRPRRRRHRLPARSTTSTSSASPATCACSRRDFVAAFPNRILNIHPSLLPAFPGLDAQQQAFDYGVKVAGCTVHFVDEQLDHGAIILQRAIPVLDTDDAHSLAERILAEEHIAYTEAIARVASGEYEIRGRRFVPRDAQSR